MTEKGINKKKFFSITVSVLMLLTCFFVYFVVVSPNVKADAFNGHYYGYGDSIMIPSGGAYETAWLSYMQIKNDPTNTSSHNVDGGSKTSTWGLTNWATHVTNYAWMTFEAFGVNDGYQGIPATTTAQNKLDMFNLTEAQGSEDHYWVCIATLCGNTTGDLAWWWPIQLNQQNVTVALLESYSIRYIPLWDSIDLVPWDGHVQLPDKAYYYDDGPVHPNESGHQNISALAWFFVSGQDRTILYNAGNDTTTVAVNYNETIYVSKQAGWNWADVSVVCKNNNTEITWTQEVDWDGNPMIHFRGVKGNFYTVSDSDNPTGIQFISISGGINGTIIYNSTPVFNWTIVSNASQYQLQVSTTSSFGVSDLIVNLSNINEINYPTYYDENTTRASFILPIVNALPSYNKYYCRVRAYA